MAGMVLRGGEDDDGAMETTSLRCDDGDTGAGSEGGDTAVCLRSGLQAAVFLSVGGGTVGMVMLIPGLAGGRAKGTNSEGGGVERSKAGDNKDKLAKDVNGEIDGGIGVAKEDSIDGFVDEMVVGSK